MLTDLGRSHLVCANPNPNPNPMVGRISCTQLEAPIARVCGADTPFPLAFEKLYLPDELKVYDAIKRTVHF